MAGPVPEQHDIAGREREWRDHFGVAFELEPSPSARYYIEE